MPRHSRTTRRDPLRCSRTHCGSIRTTVRRGSGSRTRSRSSTAIAGIPIAPGVLARADEAVTRAIALSPNYAHAHYVKAEVLALSRRFDAALATYDRAIALDPNHAAAYVSRGRSLIAIGRAAEAVAPVDKAIRLSPRDPDLFIW